MKSGSCILLFFSFLHWGFSQDLEFGQLRQFDAISDLEAKQDPNFYDKLKWLDLGKRTYLSLGGSYRFQTEGFINEQFSNEEDQDDVWYLNRFLLHAHVKIANRFEVFGELVSSTVISKEELVPVDKDVLAFNQLFARYNFGESFSLLVGRENLRLGSRRLIDYREGPNVRRSFDIFRMDYTSDKVSVTGLLGTPVNPMEGVFDNDYLSFDEILSSLYMTYNFSQDQHLDAYYFYQKDNDVTYNNATGDERRSSIGIRHFGKFGDFTFDNEAIYQFGKIDDQDISAWTVSIQLENQGISLGEHSLNIGVKTEVISGDKDAEDQRMNTFDALYPRGAYFGRVARFGPANLIDFHPYINTRLDRLFLEVDYDAFWRHSKEDGIYNAALILEYPSINDFRFIAHQIGTMIGYEVSNHIGVELETNLIFPARFLKESNLDQNLFHVVFTAEAKF